MSKLYQQLQPTFQAIHEELDEQNKVTGDEIAIVRNSIGLVKYWGEDREVSAYGYTVSKCKNAVTINGVGNGTTGRWKMTGNFTYAGSRATSEGWDKEIYLPAGRYTFVLNLVSGSNETNNEVFIRVFDSSSTQLLQVNVGTTKTYDFVGGNILVVLTTGSGTYVNAVYTVDIYSHSAAKNFREFVLSNDGFEVPAYFENQISTAITKINSDIDTGKTAPTYGSDIEAFIFITDVHWNNNKKHSPDLIKRIVDQTPINTVICGGDIIYSHNASKAGAVSEIRDFIGRITRIPYVEFYNAHGNHDDNSNSNSDYSLIFTKREQFSLLYPFANQKNVHWVFEDAPSVYNDTVVKNDYYVDHPATRTRFLFLDWNNPFNGARATWAQSVLARNDGYRVIVIYHGIYKVANETTLTEEHTAIMPYLEPYKGKIVAIFSGHTHSDYIADFWGDGSTPVIITDCDMFTEGSTEKTVTEQCFDVVVVDYKNSTINMTRIGRGSDRSTSFALS